jgi:hypothetical protein
MRASLIVSVSSCDLRGDDSIGPLGESCAEREVLGRCFEQIDQEVIGRDSCRGNDPGVQVPVQRQARLFWPPGDAEDLPTVSSSPYAEPRKEAE